MDLTVGLHLRARTSACELVVVSPPSSPGVLLCAGDEMGVESTRTDGAEDSHAPHLALGKRFHDEESGLELLCVRAGAGPLTFAGRELQLRVAKPLPASD